MINAVAVRQIVSVMLGVACIWLTLLSPQPTRADAPVCLDPKTNKEIPCTPTPEPASGGEGQPGSAETNGRLCLAEYVDLNFNTAQDPGEPLVGGGQVKVINLVTGAITLADLLTDGPQCLFLPGGSDYHGEGIPAPGYFLTGANTFDIHLETSSTIQILFATSNSPPAPTATLTPTVKPPTATLTPTSTNTASPTFTETLTPTPTFNAPTATLTATASVTPTATAVGQVIGIVEALPPPTPQPPGVFWPWLTGVGLGLLTAGIAGVSLAKAAWRMGRSYWQASQSPAANRRGVLPSGASRAGEPSPSGDDPPQVNGFDYVLSPSQQTLIQPAFTSNKSPRPNDQLRPAGPGPGQTSNNIQDYEFSLVKTVPAFNPWRLWLSLGSLAMMAIGGVALGVVGALGFAGKLPMDWWPVSGLGLMGAVLGWSVNGFVQTYLKSPRPINLPEVSDEVIVAFEHGDIRTPYVIGALWGNNGPASGSDNKQPPNKHKPDSDFDDKRHSHL